MAALVGMSCEELVELAGSLGEPAFRGRQLHTWVYKRAAESVEAMTDLPRSFRDELGKAWQVGTSSIAHVDSAPDGTAKYLLRLNDAETIETVYLPYAERVSVCVSSQVGCPAGCTFCATAIAGFARNLGRGEIVDQVLACRRLHPNRTISHAVFMGMGEPLLNYEEVVAAVRMLISDVGMSGRNITVSTVGIAPAIVRLAGEGLPVTLALSLHAPDDETRAKLVPTARKWSVAQVLDACREYRALTRRNLTFEYILIAGVNDAPEQAAQLAGVLGDLAGNVNLIPFNQVDTSAGFRRPSNAAIAEFGRVLENLGRPTTQRMERGHSIRAACGQLRRQVGYLAGD